MKSQVTLIVSTACMATLFPIVFVGCGLVTIPTYCVTKILRTYLTEPSHRRMVNEIESAPDFDPNDDGAVAEELSYRSDWMSGLLAFFGTLPLTPALALWEQIDGTLETLSGPTLAYGFRRFMNRFFESTMT